MTADHQQADAAAGTNQAARGVRRRTLFKTAGAAGVTAALTAGGFGAGRLSAAQDIDEKLSLIGSDIVDFYGARQAGVGTSPQAHACFIGLNLKPDTDAKGLTRMLQLLTDDAARLSTGTPPLADPEPELALRPARLTVTFGFGRKVMDLLNPQLTPEWLKPLPKYGIDKLQKRYTGGDLLLQICADDPLTVAHARRMLLKDSRYYTTMAWIQHGFRNARGSYPEKTTMRNLFGQVDGSANPDRGSENFDYLVYGEGELGHIPAGMDAEKGGHLKPWFPNATSLVLRRIEMNLDTWDELDRPAREMSVGRTLDTGAPITGGGEFDEPDFEKINPHGFPAIPDISHMRRSRSDNPDEQIFRRAYNYEDVPDAVWEGEADEDTAVSNAGLLFASYQADVEKQYMPIQQRLADLDHLNIWTTPIGSAVFVIPPGADEGEYVGQKLVEHT
ncbi:Dyp-type peroxidase [Micrococcoides hystricis]|uniref:Dyp-type peroxidase n=1 Tax=Micrococcoides hystricis TaxID=1572761 RepID=A0ABV6PEW9_9MICC